ncbi:MAG: PrsW family intramembrane metalloprotease [Candidatus Pacebacteria bacterium]|nr:PrsW family intramembrane metalloprotease [Candidatus Paceibacterota bacterium]MBP9840369.1 PrsW family intramembrane metalloprotease [Candidatus Paceibacterota bacterium]
MITSIALAFAIGFLPALIWLFLLLQEDAPHPEPKRIIALAFLAGALSVLVALPLEQMAQARLTMMTSVIFAWAVIEEVVKYAAAAALILWRKWVDEPIDYVIYLIVIGLGFAAFENVLFVLSPFTGGEIMAGFLTGNLRFIGSTLLHVFASALIGFALAFSYKKPWSFRVIATALGLVLASSLHALFNLLIISKDGNETVAAFFFVWTGVVVVLALMEVLRYQARQLSRKPR